MNTKPVSPFTLAQAFISNDPAFVQFKTMLGVSDSSTYRVTKSGDQRVTNTGDNRIAKSN